MHPSLFLAALCLGIASVAPQLPENLDEDWSWWKVAYGKQYDENEEWWRRVVWEKNLRRIEQHNQEYVQGKHSFTMVMNALGDLSNEEFRQVMNGLKMQERKEREMFQASDSAKPPSSVDWRERGYVTPVKNQGPCGSCWAFSATGALEGLIVNYTGRLVSLSEQNLMDCSQAHGNEGCSGGLMDYAFQYVKDNGGLSSEESYPYLARDGYCKYRPEKSAANDTGFTDIHPDEESLMLAVATVGPISAGIDASLDTFRFYHKGIYYDPNCSSEDLDHGVLVVGYGSQRDKGENKNYWIIKNSWSPEWGMQGYMLLAKDRDNHCGIASMASFPVV